MAHKERHTAPKKKGGAVKILLAVVLLLVLAAGAAGVFAYNEIHGNGKPGTEVTVSIPQGSGVAAIAQELKDAGVIRMKKKSPTITYATKHISELAVSSSLQNFRNTKITGIKS